MLITIIFLLYITYLLNPEFLETIFNSSLTSKKASIPFRIDTNVEDFRWKGNRELVYIKGGKLHTINVVNRERGGDLEKYVKEAVGREKMNDYSSKIIFSATDSNMVCIWENIEKSSPTDFGTIVTTINLKKKESINHSLVQTLKIVNCNDSTVVLSEAFPFLLEQNFELDMKTGKLVESDLKEQPESVSEIDKYSIKKKRGKYEVAKSRKRLLGTFEGYNSISRYYISIDEKYIAYTEENGSLWTAELTKVEK